MHPMGRGRPVENEPLMQTRNRTTDEISDAESVSLGAIHGSRNPMTPEDIRKTGLSATTSTDRDTRIVHLRESGMTLAAIALEFGITRERVRQICIKNDGKSAKTLREEAEYRREGERKASTARIAEFLSNQPGSTLVEISEACGVSVSIVNSLIPDELKRLVLHEFQWRENPVRQWADAEILDLLRTASTYEFPLSAKKYANLVQIGELTGPSVPRIHQRFGGWSRACELAGVEHGATHLDYNSKWTDDDLVRCVISYLGDPNFNGTFHGYDDWRCTKSDDAPSGGTIRNRFGDWTTVKAIAFTEMRKLNNQEAECDA
jgi:hypothetical protein